MLHHHIQQSIVRSLASSSGLRFSELKPDDIENKLFDYHLKITIRDGYVKKTDEGVYSLTAEGKRMGTRNFATPDAIADSAYSVLFLVIRRADDDAWLLYRRNTHPLLNKTGFMHAVPIADKTVDEAAHDQVLDKTGLSCNFTALGGGFITTMDEGELEGHVNFSLLYCDDAQGELTRSDTSADYYWEQSPNFASEDMIPNMQLLARLYDSKITFFVDEVVRV